MDGDTRKQFRRAVIAAVDAYFDARGLSRKGNLALYLQVGLFFVLILAGYLYLLFSAPAPFVAVPILIVLSVLCGSLLFSLGHDALHGAFSQHHWLNQFVGFWTDVLGVSSTVWSFKHNILHHRYLNVDRWDTDLNNWPMMTSTLQQRPLFFHRYQHFYCWVLYALVFFVVYIKDWVAFFTGKYWQHRIPKYFRRSRIRFILGRFVHVIVLVLIPLCFFHWSVVMLSLIIYYCCMGLFVSVVSQITHLTEGSALSDHANADLDEQFHNAIKGSSDYATHNAVLIRLVGGMNCHVAHHLFPSVCFVHYQALSLLIRNISEKFNVQYIERRTLRKAIMGHYYYMRTMGRR